MNHFTAAGGMTDMHRSLYAQVLDHGRDVVGTVVHIVPVPDLAGTPVATPVVGNDPVTFAQEKQHLRVPIICAQWPAMMEENDLGIAWAPVLVENFNTVSRGDVAHVRLSQMK